MKYGNLGNYIEIILINLNTKIIYEFGQKYLAKTHFFSNFLVSS